MKIIAAIIATILVVLSSFIVIRSFNKPESEIVLDTNMQKLKISSSAFEESGNIPSKYTCDGVNIVPPLQISDIPAEARSLAIIMDDPDTAMGTFVHWVKWNIPVKETRTEEGVEPSGVSGKGDRGKTNYLGPCPPDGEHRYFFKVYALDSELNLSEGSSKAELLKAMESHVIASGELMGKYARIKQQ